MPKRGAPDDWILSAPKRRRLQYHHPPKPVVATDLESLHAPSPSSPPTWITNEGTDLTRMSSAATELQVPVLPLQLIRGRASQDMPGYWKRQEKLEFKGDAWLEAIIAIIFPNRNSSFYRACVNNLTLYRGAQASGFLGRLRLEGLPHVNVKKGIKAIGDAVEAALGTVLDIRYGGHNWTEIDVVQNWPIAIYLGLGGGYLGTRPRLSSTIDRELLYQGNETQLRAQKAAFENRVPIGEKDRMKDTGTCLLKAVTRLFAATGEEWDQGTATSKGQRYHNRLKGWEVYVAGLQRGRRTLKAVASVCAIILGDEELGQYIL